MKQNNSMVDLHVESNPYIKYTDMHMQHMMKNCSHEEIYDRYSDVSFLQLRLWIEDRCHKQGKM
jgi:hypothetical protein